jgi:predicted ATPase
LLQFPKLVNDAEIVTLRQRSVGATRERMLRELVDMLAALTTEAGVVLVLDDLQWSDPTTLEFLLYLGRQRRRLPMRLMVIGMSRLGSF